jgi:CHAT domain-containing protein/tetratricopeptide (TPR) repeat protein
LDNLCDRVVRVTSKVAQNPPLNRAAQTLWPNLVSILAERSRQDPDAAWGQRLDDLADRAAAMYPEFMRRYAKQNVAQELRVHRGVQIRFEPFDRDNQPGRETVVGFAPWGVYAIRFYDGHWATKDADGQERIRPPRAEVFFDRGQVTRVDVDQRPHLPVMQHWLRVSQNARREIATSCLVPGYVAFRRGDFYAALAIWQRVGKYLGLIGDLRPNRDGIFAGNVESSALEAWQFIVPAVPFSQNDLLDFATRMAYLTEMPSPAAFADACVKAGELDGALSLYELSLRFADKGHDTQEKVRVLERLAEVYLQLGNYDRAIECLFTSLDLESTLGYSAKVIENLHLLAQDPDDAATLKRTMEIRSHAMAVNRCCKLGLVAALYLELGEDEKSQTYLAEAERMARPLGNKYLEADLLALRAQQDLLQERWSLAIERLERALKLAADRLTEQQQDETGQVLLGRGLAWHTFTVQEPRQFHVISMKSLTSPWSYQAFLASLLAEAYGQAALADPARAAQLRAQSRDWQTKARDTYRQCEDKHGELVSDFRLASLLIAEGAPDQAAQLLPGIRQQAEQRGLFEVLWRVHMLEGDVLRSRGERAGAITALEQAAREVESVRARIRSEPVRRSFFGSKMDVYERLIDLYWANRGATADTIRAADEQVFRCMERAKARALLDVLGGQPLSWKGPEVVQVRQAFPLLFGQLGGMGGGTLEQTYGQFLETVAERPAWQELSSLQIVQPATLSQVQASLPPGRLLVEFADTATHLYAAVVSSSALRIVRADGYGRDALRADVASFREVLENPAADCKPLGLRLCERLLAPFLRDEVGVTSVCIVPGGPLHYIPFAALVLPNQQYVAERLEVTYAASASALVYARQRRPPAVASAEAARLLVVANPRPHLGFSELPCATVEGEQIAALIPGARLLRGAEATEPAVLKALAQTQYFHFAGHTHLPSASPLRAALMCTENAEADGRLEVRELFGLNLRKCELAVLSACETHLGRWGRGDEIVGLERAFLRAGVAAVVTSLWKVDDAAAQVLMVAFYRQLMERKQGPAAALRAAQLELLRGDLAAQVNLAQRALGAPRPLPGAVSSPPGPAAPPATPPAHTITHPRYWAAFVLCGVPAGWDPSANSSTVRTK